MGESRKTCDTPESGKVAISGTTRLHDLPAHLYAAADVNAEAFDAFPMKINSHLLALIRSADDPLGRQFIPHADELRDTDSSPDPLAEEHQSPAPQVIHRYPRRVVLLVSNQCAVHCRFCMRKRRVAESGQVPRPLVDAGIAYIRSSPQINEVILSGGDPLMLGDDYLIDILKRLRGLPHVRLLRIHTRMPGVDPQRVTPTLVRRLAAFHPLFINIHFNHPLELTAQAAEACRRLADAGIPLGSQTVLLKGINDDVEILRELMQTLLVHRIRPYYIHQVDRVPGTAHFRVPIEKSLQLMDALRGELSGMAVPHLMIDLPGGGGKVALTPDVLVSKQKDHWLLRNWQGKIFACPCD